MVQKKGYEAEVVCGWGAKKSELRYKKRGKKEKGSYKEWYGDDGQRK